MIMTFNKLFVTALCLIALSFVRCQKDELDQQNFTEKFKTNLKGTILDENGVALSGVTVKANGLLTTTNTDGDFVLNNVPVAENILVTTTKEGFFDGGHTQFVKSGTLFNLKLTMIRKNFSYSFSASNGGKLTVGGNCKVDFEPNSIVTVSGSPYVGTVKTALTYFDPNRANGAQKLPGGFTGIDANGKITGYSSYGVIGVEMQGVNGERLQIKKGSTATLSFPIPVSRQAKAPATITLGSFEPTTGLWKAEHTATLQNGKYVGQVSHFSFWNCLVFFESINITAAIKDKNNVPVSAWVAAVGLGDTASIAYGYTNELGILEGKIPKNTKINLIILADDCGNTQLSKQIGPFAQDTDLGDLVIDFSSKKLLITGTVKDCNGTLLRGAPLRVYEATVGPNAYTTLTTNDFGEYSFNTKNCSDQQYKIIAYDLQQNKESDLVAVTELAGTVVKNITVCKEREIIKLRGNLVDLNGKTLTAEIILGEATDTNTLERPTYTLPDGSFTLEVPKNKAIKLNFFVINPCGTSMYYDKLVGPFSVDADLGTLTVAYTKPLITISGKLTDCNGNPVTNGTVRYGSTTSSNNAYVIANKNGEYSLTLNNCGQSTYTVVAYDNQNNKLSAPFTVSSNGNYSKNFSICTAPDEFVKIQSSNPTLQEELNQIVTLSDSSKNIRVSFYEDVSGTNNQLQLNLNINNGTAGICEGFSYRSGGLAIELTNGFTSNVVNLAQYPVASGGYYEGTFELKGLTKSGTTEKIDLTGTFRLRKY